MPLDGAGAPSRVEVFARLAPGVSLSAAEDEGTQVAAGTASAKPDARVTLTSLTNGLLDTYARRAILALSGGVVLVFVIFCANAAGLILARTQSRRSEFAIASSLGASRTRLIRQSIVENVLIGAAGAAAGLGIAWWMTGVAVSAMPASMTFRTLNAVAVDWRAVMAASALGVVAAVGAGLPPAWLGTRVNAVDSLRLAVRGATASRASRRWSRALLAGEVAMATALLVGAGVLTLSFSQLMRADSGLDVEHVTTASVTFPTFAFADKASRLAIADAVASEVRALPGVSAVTASYGAPPRGGAIYFGDVASDAGITWPNAVVTSIEVQPEFFDVFGIRLVTGRALSPGDGPEAVVVGRALADRLWPEGSPVGRTFTVDTRPYRVVGVAAEVRNTLNDPTSNAPEFYENFRAGRGLVMLGLRCEQGCPSPTVIADRIRAVSPNVMVGDVAPLVESYRDQFDRPRAAASIAAMFAAVAVLASAGGLFSVLTVTVGQRRRELGVRLALGARRDQIRALVAADGLGVVVVGLAVGAGAAWAASTFLSSLAYGVSAADPLVWVLVLATLLGAAVAAIWRPAVTAGRLDPMELLRDN
jgi:predicted permease